jgi:hypothetical protein
MEKEKDAEAEKEDGKSEEQDISNLFWIIRFYLNFLFCSCC